MAQSTKNDPFNMREKFLSLIEQSQTVLKVYRFNKLLTGDILAKLMAIGMMPFFIPEFDVEPNSNHAKMIGGILTCLYSYIAESQFPIDIELQEVNISLEEQFFETEADLDIAAAPALAFFSRLFQINDVLRINQAFPVIVASLCIFIGKDVKNDRDTWFKKRWKALADVSAVSFRTNSATPIPLKQNCTGFHSILSTFSNVRAVLFYILRALAESENTYRPIHYRMYQYVLQHLEWSECHHIWMIDKYILKRHPYILDMDALPAQEKSSMSQLTEFLEKFEEEDRPYLKLMYDHRELQPTYSKNFPYLIAAARTISEMKSYDGPDLPENVSDDPIQNFQDKVLTLIHQRSRAAMKMIGTKLFCDTYGMLYDKADPNFEIELKKYLDEFMSDMC